MNDNSKYVNAYIDVVMKIVHENLTRSIQQETQIKVINDLILEKDEVINRLSKELESHKVNTEESNKNKQAAANWESQYNAMKNKAAHVDGLTNQVNDMKRIIQEKDQQISALTQEKNDKIAELEEQIKSLTNPKINRRRKSKDVLSSEIVTDSILSLPISVTSPESGSNDF